MVSLSSIAGGGSGGGGGGMQFAEQVEGYLYGLNPLGDESIDLAANRDYMVPFVPQIDLTVDTLTVPVKNSCDIIAGIYDSDLSLLTDCTVQSPGSAGEQDFTTTEISLLAGALYYGAVNVDTSYIVTGFNGYASSVVNNSGVLNSNRPPVPIFPLSFASTDRRYGIFLPCYYKSRTTAALPATQDLAGFTLEMRSVFDLYVGKLS